MTAAGGKFIRVCRHCSRPPLRRQGFRHRRSPSQRPKAIGENFGRTADRGPISGSKDPRCEGTRTPSRSSHAIPHGRPISSRIRLPGRMETILRSDEPAVVTMEISISKCTGGTPYVHSCRCGILDSRCSSAASIWYRHDRAKSCLQGTAAKQRETARECRSDRFGRRMTDPSGRDSPPPVGTLP
jgi:hypothetical protein